MKVYQALVGYGWTYEGVMPHKEVDTRISEEGNHNNDYAIIHVKAENAGQVIIENRFLHSTMCGVEDSVVKCLYNGKPIYCITAWERLMYAGD
jgi:hypothetical protein